MGRKSRRQTLLIGVKIAEKIFHSGLGTNVEDIVDRLRIRAKIRRQIPSRKSVQEGKVDRIADLLDEAAAEIERLRG